MIRLVRVTLWLIFGAVVIAGLYWAFLNTPESNLLMLAASALLTLIAMLVAGVVVNTGIHLAAGEPLASIRRAPRGLPWFGAALVIVALGWWAVLRCDAWVAAHQGEISAWFIAQFNWTDISRLLWADAWLSRWLRWVAIPLTGLSLLAGWLRPDAGRRWWRRAWNIRASAVSSLVFLLLFALPLQLVDWRPTMPPNWMEPTAATARLGVVALCLAVGTAVLMMLASRADAPVAAAPVREVPPD